MTRPTAHMKQAQFCTLKASSVEEARQYIRQGLYTWTPYVVQDGVTLTPAEFDRLTNHLGAEYDFLDGKGGAASLTEPATCEGRNWWTWSDREKLAFMRGSYRLAVLVTDGARHLLVDPSGHNYARYVAPNFDPPQ